MRFPPFWSVELVDFGNFHIVIINGGGDENALVDFCRDVKMIKYVLAVVVAAKINLEILLGKRLDNTDFIGGELLCLIDEITVYPIIFSALGVKAGKALGVGADFHVFIVINKAVYIKIYRKLFVRIHGVLVDVNQPEFQLGALFEGGFHYGVVVYKKGK